MATKLAEIGQRFTAGRRAIVESLVHAQRPLSIPEILENTSGLAQSSAYRNLTVLENAVFWARATGVTPDDAVAALDRLEVPARVRDLPVRSLSTGQRRRVSLAVTVARRPELWLLDEPHAGLDATGRDLVDGLVAEASAAGATVLFASHELERAEAVARRIVTIAGGVVTDDEVVRRSSDAGVGGEVGGDP